MVYGTEEYRVYSEVRLLAYGVGNDSKGYQTAGLIYQMTAKSCLDGKYIESGAPLGHELGQPLRLWPRIEAGRIFRNDSGCQRDAQEELGATGSSPFWRSWGTTMWQASSYDGFSPDVSHAATFLGKERHGAVWQRGNCSRSANFHMIPRGGRTATEKKSLHSARGRKVKHEQKEQRDTRKST
jgi:hypothetical protein